MSWKDKIITGADEAGLDSFVLIQQILDELSEEQLKHLFEKLIAPYIDGEINNV